MSLGATIRKLRLERKLTKQDLANMAGTTVARVRWLEEAQTAQYDSNIALLLSVCAALGVTLDELLLAAGLIQSPDPALALRLAQLERLFRAMPPDRQEDVLAIVTTLSTAPRSQGGEPPCPESDPPSPPASP